MDIVMMFKKEEGFTLVELMVVVLIIGILVAIAVPVFLNASANASAKSCQANQRTFNGALQTYQAQNQTGISVAAAGELLGGTATAPLFGATGVIKSVPKCPAPATATNPDGQYYVDQNEVIVSDKGTLAGDFVLNHELQ